MLSNVVKALHLGGRGRFHRIRLDRASGALPCLLGRCHVEATRKRNAKGLGVVCHHEVKSVERGSEVGQSATQHGCPTNGI